MDEGWGKGKGKGKDDLLRRVADPNDRRRNVLELTDKGFSLTNRVFEIEDQVSKELLQGITKEDLEGFFNVNLEDQEISKLSLVNDTLDILNKKAAIQNWLNNILRV